MFCFFTENKRFPAPEELLINGSAQLEKSIFSNIPLSQQFMLLSIVILFATFLWYQLLGGIGNRVHPFLCCLLSSVFHQLWNLRAFKELFACWFLSSPFASDDVKHVWVL